MTTDRRYPGLGALDTAEDAFAQYDDVRQPSPERRLAVAVFGEVVEDLRRGPGGSAHYDNARSWVLSDDTSWPYAFVPLCRLLDLEPSWLREGLLRIAPGHRTPVDLRQSIGTPRGRVALARKQKGRRASWWSGDRLPRRAQGGRP